MKKSLNLCVMAALLFFSSCVKNSITNPLDLISQAKVQFSSSIGADTGKHSPLWQYAYTKTVEGKDYVKVSLKLHDPVSYSIQSEKKISADLVTSLVMVKDGGKWSSVVVTKIPDQAFMNALGMNSKAVFSGVATTSDWGGKLIHSAYVPSSATVAREDMIFCITTTKWTCAYAANDPATAYCQITGSETSCYGNMSTEEEMSPIPTNGETGGGGTTTTPPAPVEIYHPTGTLCGGYNWKGIGEAKYAQMNGFGFSLVNANGQILPFNFTELCVQLPSWGFISDMAASNAFNKAWAYGLGKAVDRANTSAVLGAFFVKENMLRDMRTYFQNSLGGGYSINDKGCNGVPDSSPTYCP